MFFMKQGLSKKVLDKNLFNSRFILYFSGWFRSHWKWMEVCCNGFRQGLPDSLYFFYCATFGSCFNSSTSCNSWIRGHSLITLARFRPFLITYLPRVDIFKGIILLLLQEEICQSTIDISSTMYLPRLVKIVCERPLRKNKPSAKINDFLHLKMRTPTKMKKIQIKKKRGDFICLKILTILSMVYFFFSFWTSEE